MSENVRVWGSELIEPNTLAQAEQTASLPILAGPVALMPDAHVGIGATVGSVVATKCAIIPAAVGVDIGCGMIATLLNVTSRDLPDNLDTWLSETERCVPAGVGKGHEASTTFWRDFISHAPPSALVAENDKLLDRASKQFGSLGSGNHFIEVCLDESDRVWLVLHSGSRGVGKELAERHIRVAQALTDRFAGSFKLPDPDLAWFTENDPHFNAYVTDLLWAQEYALFNRRAMMVQVVKALEQQLGFGVERRQTVNCHHNYAALETHIIDPDTGREGEVWVTRKGAIRAYEGDYGVIPGSMGAQSFIVRGLGNEASYCSSSHGAGRRLSRGQARRELDYDGFRAGMRLQGVRTWQTDHAEELIDEAPLAYKDIDQVMRAQSDLTEVVHTLHQVANYKGVNEVRSRKKRVS